MRLTKLFGWALFCQLAVAYVPSSSLEVLSFVQKYLPLCGTLKNADGFVYVDLDDGYVHQLLPLLRKEGFKTPPYFGRPGLVGAHISVIFPKEMVGRQVKECGERIWFSVQKCEVVSPPNWKRVDEVYIILIDAPELDGIRKRYKLPSLKHAFHITVGVKLAQFNAA